MQKLHHTVSHFCDKLQGAQIIQCVFGTVDKDAKLQSQQLNQMPFLEILTEIKRDKQKAGKLNVTQLHVCAVLCVWTKVKTAISKSLQLRNSLWYAFLFSNGMF